MSNGFGTIAGVVAGYKAGNISEREANRLLRTLGCDRDLATLLAAGVGIATAFAVGDVIADAVSDIFDDLF